MINKFVHIQNVEQLENELNSEKYLQKDYTGINEINNILELIDNLKSALYNLKEGVDEDNI